MANQITPFVNNRKYTHILMIEVNSKKLGEDDIFLIKENLFNKLNQTTFSAKIYCSSQAFDIQVTWESVSQHQMITYATNSPFSDAYVSLATKNFLKQVQNEISERVKVWNWSFSFIISKNVTDIDKAQKISNGFSIMENLQIEH